MQHIEPHKDRVNQTKRVELEQFESTQQVLCGEGSAVVPGPGPENIGFQPNEVADGEAVDVKIITKFYCPKCK